MSPNTSKQVLNEFHFKELMNRSSDTVIICDEKNNFIYANKSFYSSTAYSPDEIIGMPAPDIFGDAWSCLLKNIQQTEDTSEKVLKVKSKFGEELVFMFIHCGQDIKTDTTTYRYAILRDITSQIKTEQDQKKFLRLIEQSPTSVVITDKNGMIQYVNPKFCKISGYSFEEALGNNPRILKSGKHSQKFYKNLWQTLLAGKTWRGEFENKTKDGKLYWESASISPLLDEGGNPSSFVAIKEDITKRKKDEELLKFERDQLKVYYEAAINQEEEILRLQDIIIELGGSYD